MGELVGRLGTEGALESQIWCTVAFGNRRLASGSDDGMIKIWDVETCGCLEHFCCNSGAVRSITALSETCLVTGSDDGTIKLWDVAQDSKCLLAPGGCCLAKLEGHQDRIRSLAALGPRRVASSSDDGTLKI